MALPLLPILGAVAEFVAANGVRVATRKYGSKAVEKGIKQIKARQKAIDKRVEAKKAKGEIPLREKTPLQTQKSRETRLKTERDKRIKKSPSRVDDEGFPLDEVPLKFAEGGNVDKQMSMLMEEPVEEPMLSDEDMPMIPDEQMEEDYVDYVMEETLSNEDRNYLISALEKDDRLSEIFDQVVESATEFSGSGPIEGPGNEKSDSIPARLSDGEFVLTAKATEEIGEDSLMSMMKDAEASADQRQGVAYGGMIDEEDQAVPIPTTASRAAQGNVPNVVKQSRQVEEEMLKSSPRRYYVPVSG